jgi:hypothetical protein
MVSPITAPAPFVAHHVALGRLARVGRLAGNADVEVEHVPARVVARVVEGDAAGGDAHDPLRHPGESSRLAKAVTTRAGMPA